jgi:hypothetical protein
MTPIRYECSVCKRSLPRGDLVVKRVQFREMGVSGKLILTRVVGWLCRDFCLQQDEVFQMPSYDRAPGTLAKRGDD